MIALVAVTLRARGRAAEIAIEAEAQAAEGIRPIEEARPGERGPPLPVVLVHGLFGFDNVGVPGVKVHYFRGIVDHLATLGCHAHVVRLPRAASVPDRAQMLVDKITALGHDRVDIIAHSLGGLDSRYAIAKLGLAKHVRALVTIGTPHRGSPLADLASEGAIGLAHDQLHLGRLFRHGTRVP